MDEFDAEHGPVIRRGDAPYINKRLMMRLPDMRETFDGLNSQRRKAPGNNTKAPAQAHVPGLL